MIQYIKTAVSQLVAPAPVTYPIGYNHPGRAPLGTRPVRVLRKGESVNISRLAQQR